MISFPANTEIFVIHTPVSFACGIDGMVRLCRLILNKDPINNSSYFLFINKKKRKSELFGTMDRGFHNSQKGFLMENSYIDQQSQRICTH